MFQVLELKDSEAYRKFLTACPWASLQQTFAWADFQKVVPGRSSYFALAVYNEAQQLAVTALIHEMQLPFGWKYYYVQRGPLVNPEEAQAEEAFKLLLQELKLRAKRERILFLRIDPPFILSSPAANKIVEFYHALGLRPAVGGFFPEYTLMLELKKTPEQLLAEMKQKGRYNVRLAEKKGIRIRQSTDVHDIEYFYQLLQETSQRDRFSGHNKKYYRAMLQSLEPYQACKVWVAEWQGQVLAVNILTYFKDTVTYYYGASSNQYRNLMAPYLLQWEAILEAKQAGYKYYDFLGVAPPGDSKHAWAGISDFKYKFGGKLIQYLPAQEQVYRPGMYWLWRTLKRGRKLFRK